VEKLKNAVAICSDTSSMDGRTELIGLGGRRCVGRVPSIVYNASAVTRGAGCLVKSRNGPKMVPCLLISTDR